MLAHSTLAVLDSPSVTESESQKAWHLLALLLSIGRPLSALDLASCCTLFPSSPDLVHSLCSIPDSPITLTTINGQADGVLVTVSLPGLLAFRPFLSCFNSADAFFTWIGTGVHGRMLENVLGINFRKRKRIGFDPGEVDKKYLSISPPLKRNRNGGVQVPRSIFDNPSFKSIKLNKIILLPNLFVKMTGDELICEIGNDKQVQGKMNTSIEGRKELTRNMAPALVEEYTLPRITLDNQSVCQETEVDDVHLKSIIGVGSCGEDFRQGSVVSVVNASANGASDAADNCSVEKVEFRCKEEELLIDSGNMRAEAEGFFQPMKTALTCIPRAIDSEMMNQLTPLDRKQVTVHERNQDIFSKSELSVVQKQLIKPSAKMKLACEDVTTPSRQHSVGESLDGGKAVSNTKENQQVKRNQMVMNMAQKTKQKRDSMHIKEGRKDLASVSLTEKVELKDLPHFESYIVEEEEGSGGYGIVYRARRKSDEATVAIKCPHANAHRHHVTNELRMLERFGGKNFVIKYEGCFKSGNSDCFVLEHVEHDRPEVLKKDIDIFQLRWYGYCMFRALASLHKLGVVHRDVKPGNFLFSRKANKGYLIDFNLAMDLRQKYGTANKLKIGNDVKLNQVTLPSTKSIPPTKSKRFPSAKSLDAANQEAKGLKPTLELKNQKKKAVDRTKAQNDLSGWNIMKSQGADGSGITSVKDGTSNRTPSVERLREPLPCQGRKELISLLQEAMQSPNHETSNVPASIRKRIAAPPRKMDERLVYLTPMPLHSTGIASSGTCLTKSKEDGKLKREGPCVGTKGFRAPEVLFRSPHQGPKVDIWSAGVTLLYLIIGRTPFYGDPEQNIKDIAKLRGSEDLWEVSKLHDRETSFPVDLYNIQALQSVTLREWCKMNTKRRDFLDIIPSTLIDLVDKCLTVNPRMRISAEDALKHEFFAPCHEGLRKQRLLRQGLSLDSGTGLPLHGQSIGNGIPLKISHRQT